MNFLFPLVLFVLSTTLSFGGSYNHANKKGLIISVDQTPSNLRAYKNGQTAVFSGEIEAIKLKKNKKFKSEKIKFSQLEITATFPDNLTDVTQGLGLTENDKKLKFNYTTNELSHLTDNTFTIVIGRVKSSELKLLKTKAKIEKRISYIEERINHLENHQNEKHREKRLGYLKKLKELLVSISHKIDIAIEKNPDILALARIPIQVENNISSSHRVSSQFSGHRVAIDIPLGAPIEGESTEAIFSVTNLSHKELWFPEFEKKGKKNEEDDEENHEGSNEFVAHMSFNGSLLEESEPFNVGFGQTKEFEFALNNLDPFQNNDLELKLYKVASNSTKKGHGKSKWFPLLWGKVSTELSVSEDDTSPVWSNLSQDSELVYLQELSLF